MGKSINVKVGQGRGYKCVGYMLRLRRTGYDKLGGYIKTPVDGMQGPRYECFGPWPVCPDSIVRRYV